MYPELLNQTDIETFHLECNKTQIDWLSAGLKSGLTPENFLIVQWTMQ